VSFASLNAVNAAKGMQGTNRQAAATFAGAGAPLTGAPQGMTVDYGAGVAPQGSSYTQGAGMGGGSSGVSSLATNAPKEYGTAQAGGAIGMLQSGALSNGVVPGKTVPSAVPQQAPPQMSAAEMQDPNNAAMAGFQFAAGNDRPASAPAGAVQAPPAQMPPPQAQQQAQVNPISAALGTKNVMANRPVM
jgi:hypothetical protein